MATPTSLERCVEVAHVRRADDDLRQHPGQRARFDRDRAALTVDRGTRHPAASTGQIRDDVSGSRVRLDARRKQDAGGAGASRSKTGRLPPTSAREAWCRTAIWRMLPPSCQPSGVARGARDVPASRAYASSSSSGSSSKASSVVDFRREDAIEVLDLLVLLVVLEVLLELHLLADEGALGVRAQVGRLGRGREADLAVVARVLEVSRMIRRTSLSPRLVTPAAYLLPSAMSLSSRAATRGSTTPMRTPLLSARSGGCPRGRARPHRPG